jgi:hypothetical protein
MGASANENPVEYFCASALAAAVNYPLWRASAIGQSGFVVHDVQHRHIAGIRVPPALSPYIYACRPPYKGVLATVSGMTWARASIFWGSDFGRDRLRQAGYGEAVATVVPPLTVSPIVQCINMPLVRATITIQDPSSEIQNVSAAIRYIYFHHGLAGLWHGTSAGILKTVPKYCTAVVVKDFMEEWLGRGDPNDQSDRLLRSATKSAVAGIAGAALTNPLDVIRNEMFKTNHGFLQTVRHLHKELGYSFVNRGLGKNMVAVAIPVALTIFFTDAFINMSAARRDNSNTRLGDSGDGEKY